MNKDWASENLLVIRTLMERSAVYRRALAPVMGLVGAMGVGAGAVGTILDFPSSRPFALYWSAVAVASLAGAFFLIRRQALKDAEAFWSPPMRRVGQALLPAFFVGLVVSIVFIILNTTEPDEVLTLVPVWMLLYGLALHAAGFFMPRGFRWFGWGFILAGVAGLVVLIYWPEDLPLTTRDSNVAMGLMFGGAHAAYGVYLWFTEKRRDVV